MMYFYFSKASSAFIEVIIGFSLLLLDHIDCGKKILHLGIQLPSYDVFYLFYVVGLDLLIS